MEKWIKELSQLGHRLSGTINNTSAVKMIQDRLSLFDFEIRLYHFLVTGTLTYRFILHIVFLFIIYFFLNDVYFPIIFLYIIIVGN